VAFVTDLSCCCLDGDHFIGLANPHRHIDRGRVTGGHGGVANGRAKTGQFGPNLVFAGI